MPKNPRITIEYDSLRIDSANGANIFYACTQLVDRLGKTSGHIEAIKVTPANAGGAWDDRPEIGITVTVYIGNLPFGQKIEVAKYFEWKKKRPTTNKDRFEFIESMKLEIHSKLIELDGEFTKASGTMLELERCAFPSLA